VLSYLLYSIGWASLDFGRAAALALMLGVINLALIGGTLRITRVQQRSV
jgi:ABC-type sugar transport system permease subunit